MKKTFELTVDEITDACHLWLVHTNRFPNYKQSRVGIKFPLLRGFEIAPIKQSDIAAVVEIEGIEEELQHKQG